MSPTAAIIIIGNEILSGRTQDMNVQFMARRLVALGIQLRLVLVIPDEEQAIVRHVGEASRSHTYVFTTGGIGPTHDDITAEAIAKVFGRSMVRDEKTYQVLLDYYGSCDLTPPQAKMAMIPQGASLIPNQVAGASGFRLENVFVMAGIPTIMQAMFEAVEDQLQRGAPILSDTVLCHLGESLIAQGLGVIQKKHPRVDIGSYPFYGQATGHGAHLVIKGTDPEEIARAAAEVRELVKKLGGCAPHTKSES